MSACGDWAEIGWLLVIAKTDNKVAVLERAALRRGGSLIASERTPASGCWPLGVGSVRRRFTAESGVEGVGEKTFPRCREGLWGAILANLMSRVLTGALVAGAGLLSSSRSSSRPLDFSRVDFRNRRILMAICGDEIPWFSWRRGAGCAKMRRVGVVGTGSGDWG